MKTESKPCTGKEALGALIIMATVEIGRWLLKKGLEKIDSKRNSNINTQEA